MPRLLRVPSLWLVLSVLVACGGQAATQEVRTAGALELQGLPATWSAGQRAIVTITARDALGDVMKGYRGTVHLSSSDPAAVLPADVTFTASDAGARAIEVVLETMGSQSLTVTEVGRPALAATSTCLVTGPASRLELTGLPATSMAGTPARLTITARDVLGNVAAGYRGTVHLSSSDPAGVLQGDEIFTAHDAGQREVLVVLETPGAQTVTATDLFTPALSVGATCLVVARPRFLLGGAVLGLEGSGLTLAAPGQPDLVVPAEATTFVFANLLAASAPYEVTVAKQPSPSQVCVVLGGSGVVGNADVTTVSVRCRSVWTQVAVGGNHTVGVRPDGTLWAWGSNASGQLGDGTTTDRHAPVQVGSGFAMAAAGDEHTLAIKLDGTLWAWGGNLFGQLGEGTNEPRTLPVQVGEEFASIAAGALHSIAVKKDGALWVWGNNSLGQLADGTKANRSSPYLVGAGYASAAGGYGFVMAVKRDGTLWGWGDNTFGQLCDGTTTERLAPVQAGSGYASVATGALYVQAITTDGTLWACGQNGNGTLGDGTPTDRLTLTQVGSGYASATGSWDVSAAVKTDGTLWTWGRNLFGQFGDGSIGVTRLLPTQVGSGYATVSAGGTFLVAIKADGTLWAWGDNTFGQLGDGTTDQRTAPVLVAGAP